MPLAIFVPKERRQSVGCDNPNSTSPCSGASKHQPRTCRRQRRQIINMGKIEATRCSVATVLLCLGSGATVARVDALGSVERACVDTNILCSTWAGTDGYCAGAYATFMKNQCPLSCNHCSAVENTTPRASQHAVFTPDGGAAEPTLPTTTKLVASTVLTTENVPTPSPKPQTPGPDACTCAVCCSWMST